MLGRQVVALGDGFADKMQAAIVSALAAPEVAEKVLASIKPLFHSGDVVQLTALDPEGGPPNIVCADLSSEKGNGELIAFIQAYMRAQDCPVWMIESTSKLARSHNPL